MKPPKGDDEFGSRGREADYFSKLRRLLAKMEPGDQNLLLHMAQKVARGSNRSADVFPHPPDSYNLCVSTDFLDRLANQLRANKSAACRRAIQRILPVGQANFGDGKEK